MALTKWQYFNVVIKFFKVLIYLFFILFTFVFIFAVGIFFFINIIRKTEDIQPLVNFLTGFTILSVFLNYYSIYFPINLETLFYFLILLILLSLKNYRELIKYLAFVREFNKMDYFVFALLICFISFFGANGIRNFDSTLYHVQNIKWISEFPVVPGLGNIHGRFAFNSMFFPISSLFSFNQVLNKEILIFPLNSALFLVFLLWQYFNFKKAFREGDTAMLAFIVIIVFLPIIYLLKWVGSPTPDFACAILCIIVLSLLFKDPEFYKSNIYLVPALIFLIISFKLSLIPLVFILLLKLNWSSLFKDIQRYFIIGFFIFLPFIARNYYISGYLIYPFPFIDLFNPDWKMPVHLVVEMKNIIKAWAIQPNNNPEEILKMSVFEWFPSWVMGMEHLMKLLLFICILFLIFGTTTFILRKNGPDIRWVFFIGIIFLFWFLQAPDPRFIYGIIFFTVAYFMYWFSRNLFLLFPKINFKLYILTFILGFLGLTGSIYFKTVLSYRENLSQFVFPSAFYKDFEKPVIKEYKSPFRYFAPEKNGNCFNAPLPCATGVLEENIELRGTTLAAGFRVRK